MKDLVEIVRDQHKKAKENGAPCSGIIYVHKRDATGTISKVLQKVCAVYALINKVNLLLI